MRRLHLFNRTIVLAGIGVCCFISFRYLFVYLYMIGGSLEKRDEVFNSAGGQISAQNRARIIPAHDSQSAPDVRMRSHVAKLFYKDPRSDVDYFSKPADGSSKGGDPSAPLILYWSTFFGGDYGYLDGDRYSLAHCGLGIRCRVTKDKSKFSQSAALLIHPTDHVDPIPASRQPWQRLVFYFHEPPSKLSNVEGIAFNMTMTYRRDSDVYMPYGFFLGRGESADGTSTDYAVGKTHLVMWVVSNCNAPSKRQNYVRELQKHVQVDIYGACGKKRCDRTGRNSCWVVSRKYKFYLSFENQLTKDYITEKTFERMHLGLVPVVLGGGDYKNVLPPRSYIDVADFKSPNELAGYLKQLDADDTLYSSYHEWRRHLTVSMTRAPAFCDLCEKLSSSKTPYKSYKNIVDWFTNGTAATPGEVYPHLVEYFEDDKQAAGP